MSLENEEDFDEAIEEQNIDNQIDINEEQDVDNEIDIIKELGINNVIDIIEGEDADNGSDIINFYIKTFTRYETVEETATSREEYFEDVEEYHLEDHSEEHLEDHLEDIVQFDIVEGIEAEESTEDLDLAELRKLVELQIDEVSEEFSVTSVKSYEVFETKADKDQFQLSVEGGTRSDIYDIIRSIWADTTEYLGEVEEIDDFLLTHPLAELTDDEIIKIIDKLQTDNKHLQLENEIFLNVLRQDAPTIFEDAENFVENNLIKHSVSRKSIQKIRLITGDNEERITFAQKTDLLLRETQAIKTRLDILKKRSHQLLSNLKAEVEEIDIRKSDLKAIMDSFDNTFNLLDDDPGQTIKTIPMEKFVTFVQNTIRRVIVETDKIRLYVGSLKKQYKKVSLLVKQKEQIGEDIHPVDLQLLEIERERLQQEIELKAVLLKDLHGMNGGANLLLSNQTKDLLKNENLLKTIQKSIDLKAVQIARLQKECKKAVKELQRNDEVNELSRIQK